MTTYTTVWCHTLVLIPFFVPEAPRTYTSPKHAWLAYNDSWQGVLHHVCGEHSWAESQCSHGAHVEEESSKKYLTKTSKAMAALRKVILDWTWLQNLHFYVRFRWVTVWLSVPSHYCVLRFFKCFWKKLYKVLGLLTFAADTDSTVVKLLRQKTLLYNVLCLQFLFFHFLGNGMGR